RIYERRWALTLLEQVLARLRAEYEAAGKLLLFDRLKELLARESGQPSQAEIAAEMQMTENAVKQAFHRLRHRYRQLLHEEIAHTVAAPDDVEDELRHFIAVLQTEPVKEFRAVQLATITRPENGMTSASRVCEECGATVFG